MQHARATRTASTQQAAQPKTTLCSGTFFVTTKSLIEIWAQPESTIACSRGHPAIWQAVILQPCRLRHRVRNNKGQSGADGLDLPLRLLYGRTKPERLVFADTICHAVQQTFCVLLKPLPGCRRRRKDGPFLAACASRASLGCGSHDPLSGLRLSQREGSRLEDDMIICRKLPFRGCGYLWGLWKVGSPT